MNLQALKQNLNNDINKVLTKLGIEFEDFGDNIYSTCPIHEGSDNPRAFSFCKSKGIWKCWTRDCQEHHRNDIFGLICGVLSAQSGKDAEFKDALEWIKKELKISIKYNSSVTTTSKPQEPTDIESINKIFKRKSKTSQDNPVQFHCDCQIPSTYFHNRGFSKRTLKHFGVGDCLENGIMNERSVIPIHNDTGDIVVGAIGRSMKEYKTPKFLITPKGFDKNNYFYNFHRAIKIARQTHTMYILEGQGDVWRMYEAGVKNAVSVFGKTLSRQHIEKLKQLPITHLVVITDNDQAGREARIKIQRSLSRMYSVTFPKLSNKDVGDMSVEDIKNNILIDLKGTY